MKINKNGATLTKEELIEILETLEEPIKTTFKTKEEALKNIYAENFIITSENEMVENKSLLSILSELVHKYKLIDNKHPVSITADYEKAKNSIDDLEALLSEVETNFNNLDLERVPFNISKGTQDLASIIKIRLEIIKRCSNGKRDLGVIKNFNEMKRLEKGVYRNLSELKIHKLKMNV